MKTNICKYIIAPTATLAAVAPTTYLITSCSEYYIPMIFSEMGLCGTTPYVVTKGTVYKYRCTIEGSIFTSKPKKLTFQTSCSTPIKVLKIKSLSIKHNDNVFYSKEDLTAPVEISLTDEMREGDKLYFTASYDEDGPLSITSVMFTF